MTEHENLNEEWLGQASKPELMALARDLGLSIEGKKYQIRNRLLDLVEEPEEEDEGVEDLEPDNPNWPKHDDLGSALADLVGTGSTSELDFDSIESSSTAEISFDDDNGYLIDDAVANNTSDDLFVIHDEEEVPVAVAQISLPKEIDPEFAELRSKRLRERPIFYDDGVLELYKQRLVDATSEMDKARITEQINWLEENGKFEFSTIPEPEEEEEEPELEDESEEEVPASPVIGIVTISEEEHTQESLENMTKVQLKEILRDLGLPVSGNKSVLIERILEWSEPEEDDEEDMCPFCDELEDKCICDDDTEWEEEEIEEVD